MTVTALKPRPRARFYATAGLCLTIGFALLALGVWQLQRRVWKLDLIARIDQRIAATPVAPPGPADWTGITASRDAYRRLTGEGVLLAHRDTLVQAVTRLGAGFWVMTPLRTDAGFTILVNRGFVPADDAKSFESDVDTRVQVTGLLRMSEPKGGFLRSNDPASGRWYSRDVAAIARARGLGSVAPYFIDEEATPGVDYPAGGLTVVSLPNNHLIYALTWFSLAALAFGSVGVLIREEAMRRHGFRIDGAGSAPTHRGAEVGGTNLAAPSA